MPPPTARADLTVIIPSKNRGDSVERLIRSLERQELPPAEIVVVDDGSDPPIRLPSYPQIPVLRNEVSSGACVARNVGIRHAHHDLLVVFDDDVECHDPGLLKRAVRLAESHPDVGVIAFRHLDPHGNPNASQPAPSPMLCEAATFFGYGALIRRQAIRDAGPFEEAFVYGYEEQELSMRIVDSGWRILYDPGLSVLHHHDPRGRNWRNIHRNHCRNQFKTMIKLFPWPLVAPAVMARWMRFVLDRRERGEWDLGGAVLIGLQALMFVPRGIRLRRPISLASLRQFHRLRRSPVPLSAGTTKNNGCRPAVTAES